MNKDRLYTQNEFDIALIQQQNNEFYRTLLDIKAEIKECKIDIRWVLGLMGTGFLGLLGLMAHGFHWINW